MCVFQSLPGSHTPQHNSVDTGESELSFLLQESCVPPAAHWAVAEKSQWKSQNLTVTILSHWNSHNETFLLFPTRAASAKAYVRAKTLIPANRKWPTWPMVGRTLWVLEWPPPNIKMTVYSFLLKMFRRSQNESKLNTIQKSIRKYSLCWLYVFPCFLIIGMWTVCTSTHCTPECPASQAPRQIWPHIGR